MGKKILIIDDEKIVCIAVKKELEKEGYKVECASNGSDGVKIIKENGFQIVIVDLMLPDIDGVEVCKEIKKECPRVKVILMSGHSNKIEERKEDFISAGGCKRFIRKPFNEGELVELTRDEFEKGAGC